MECPNCYDDEIQGSGFGRVVKKSHLKMDHLCYEDGYEHFQCPRCLRTRKKKNTFFSPALIKETSHEEAQNAVEAGSSGGVVVLGALAVIAVGIAVLCATTKKLDEN